MTIKTTVPNIIGYSMIYSVRLYNTKEFSLSLNFFPSRSFPPWMGTCTELSPSIITIDVTWTVVHSQKLFEIQTEWTTVLNTTLDHALLSTLHVPVFKPRMGNTKQLTGNRSDRKGEFSNLGVPWTSPLGSCRLRNLPGQWSCNMLIQSV